MSCSMCRLLERLNRTTDGVRRSVGGARKRRIAVPVGFESLFLIE